MSTVVSAVLFWKSLTGGRSLAHEGHQLLFNPLEGVQVVHEEDVPVARFAGDAHQLAVVGVSKTDGKHDVTFTGTYRENSQPRKNHSVLLGFDLSAPNTDV